MHFLYRKVLGYKEGAARRAYKRVVTKDQKIIEADQVELTQLRDGLQQGFTSVNSEKGLRAQRSLTYEYDQIQLFRTRRIKLPARRRLFLTYEREQVRPILPREDETDALQAPRIFALVEATYKQGLSVLADALRIIQVIQTSNTQRLNAEIVEMENEIESLRTHGASTARVEIREATINSHNQRLELLEQQQLRVDELLFQGNNCEASLARTRVELAVLHAGVWESRVSAVTESLEKTIEQAKIVQAELRTLGF